MVSITLQLWFGDYFSSTCERWYSTDFWLSLKEKQHGVCIIVNPRWVVCLLFAFLDFFLSLSLAYLLNTYNVQVSVKANAKTWDTQSRSSMLWLNPTTYLCLAGSVLGSKRQESETGMEPSYPRVRQYLNCYI